MSLFLSQGRISLLAVHEADDYLAHLLRLDLDTHGSRFGGQLSPAALAERAKLAARDAACAMVARIDGHIRAAAELWELSGVDKAYELALSVEGATSRQTPATHDLETALMAHAIRAARERGGLRIVCVAGSSGKLPRLPDGLGTSPWRPWSDHGAWCCDLSKVSDDSSSFEAPTQPLARNTSPGMAPLRIFGLVLAGLSARRAMLLVRSLIVGAKPSVVAGTVSTLLPVSALLCMLVDPAASHIHIDADARTADWYPPDCCHDKDCRPVTSVEEKRNMLWMTTTDGFTIAVDPRQSRRQSGDDRWHVCIASDDLNEVFVRCVFEPARS